jgi:lipopolysaccharide transport system permease protein
MFSFLADSWAHRTLIWRLARREIEARFRGSFLGLFWAVIVPLAMLGVFSLVFGSIFGARWTRPGAITFSDEYSFPMIMFLGLILFAILSDPINRAPDLIMANVSYVKKVLFPLEILPVVALVNALVTAAISLVVFLAVFLVLYGLPPVTILVLPAVLLPLAFMTLGIVYFLASLGVFLRDLAQATPLLTTAIMFLSPVFYPIQQLPEQYRWLFYLNPLTTGLVQARDVVFWGHLPSVGEWFAYLAASLVVAAAGHYWFSRTKKGFADVV